MIYPLDDQEGSFLGTIGESDFNFEKLPEKRSSQAGPERENRDPERSPRGRSNDEEYSNRRRNPGPRRFRDSSDNRSDRGNQNWNREQDRASQFKNSSDNSENAGGNFFEVRDDYVRSNPSSEPVELEITNMNNWTLKELRNFAFKQNIALGEQTNRQHISYQIVRELLNSTDNKITSKGMLEVLSEAGGFGFLRSPSNYAQTSNDVYFSSGLIKTYNLKTGQEITCSVRAPNTRKGERYCSVDKILSINNKTIQSASDLNELKDVNPFDELRACYPTERYRLESTQLDPQENLTARIIDLLAPIGKGQRCVIVAPPRTGKTVLLQAIAHSLSINNPETVIMVLLIDERPEEVTDMMRSVKGEVISSTFDEPAENHVRIAELSIEKAKRLVEAGKDVVILLDSLTRLARAYNTVAPSSGKILTGGVDSGALQKPKRFFGAARNIENGGSLTIIATALTETGSKMDEVIFEEFKGTGNSEIVLDRRVAEKRIFASFDILKSGTRKEELLLSQKDLQRIVLLRRAISQLGALEAIELLRNKLALTKNNEDFLSSMGNLG